jgi:hypothetical protein
MLAGNLTRAHPTSGHHCPSRSGGLRRRKKTAWEEDDEQQNLIEQAAERLGSLDLPFLFFGDAAQVSASVRPWVDCEAYWGAVACCVT